MTSEASAENYQRKQKGFFSSKPSPIFFLVNFSIDNESSALFPNVGPRENLENLMIGPKAGLFAIHRKITQLAASLK